MCCSYCTSTYCITVVAFGERDDGTDDDDDREGCLDTKLLATCAMIEIRDDDGWGEETDAHDHGHNKSREKSQG